MRPLVSIITPSFNQGQFIEETIQSVLSQDYPKLEYIVIDGGSTDNTIDILRKYEGRLSWISEKDRGQSHAINKGFRMVGGEIVAWMNSDDTYLPGAVSKAIEFMDEHSDVMMVYGEGYLIDELGRRKGRFPATEPFNLWRLINYGDYILQQTVFLRRTVFQAISMLDENLHYGMDWDLWIRIGKRFKVAYIPEYLANLREHARAKTASGGVDRFRELVTIMRRHGLRRYPLAFFRYGWEPYQEEIVQRLRQRLPWLEWDWLSWSGSFVRRALFYLYFKTLTRLSFPCHYEDGWVADRSYFVFFDEKEKNLLRISGSTDLVPSFVLPMTISVQANDKPVGVHSITHPTTFEFQCPIPAYLRGPNCLEVTLSANRSFEMRNTHGAGSRLVAFQLCEIVLE